MKSTARAIKRNLKAAAIIQPIVQNHATSYSWPQGHTHTRTHAPTQTHTLWRNESDYKKPGVRWPVAGARLV